MNSIAVIGAGAWGTTLSLLLAEKGHQVSLWVYEPELAKEMLRTRENRRYLPGFQLSKTIEVTADKGALGGAELFFFVVPTQHLGRVAAQFKKVIPASAIIVSASKGIDARTLKLPADILGSALAGQSICALSGPNLSSEIARGLPAAAVVASRNPTALKSVQQALHQPRFRVYANVDIIGVQLGGALKNIIAIAAGIVDGLELGDNAKAGLMIRGLAEISRLGMALGARAETFSGLSGMGDLITTCASRLSRNHTVGEQIAKGKKLPEILAGMKEAAEGVPTAKAALRLGKKFRVELPITAQVYNILYRGKDPYRAISDLMTRKPISE